MHKLLTHSIAKLAQRSAIQYRSDKKLSWRFLCIATCCLVMWMRLKSTFRLSIWASSYRKWIYGCSCRSFIKISSHLHGFKLDPCLKSLKFCSEFIQSLFSSIISFLQSPALCKSLSFKTNFKLFDRDFEILFLSPGVTFIYHKIAQQTREGNYITSSTDWWLIGSNMQTARSLDKSIVRISKRANSSIRSCLH